MSGTGRRALLRGGALLLARPAVAGMALPRVAVLDWGLAQTVLALGIVPAAMPDPADYRRWVVEPALPDGIPDTGSRLQPNVEALAALRPDLILLGGDGEPAEAALRRVAPVLRLTVYAPDRDVWAHGAAAARAIGTALDRADAAGALVAAAERDMDAARHALSGRAVPPLLLASYADTRHLRVYGQGSILHAALGRMGLRNAWTGPTGTWGSATVGIDRLAAFPDAVLVSFDPAPPGVVAALGESPLWRALPFGGAGRTVALPPVLMFGTLPAAQRFARLLVPRLLSAAP